jgi:hypothetical protein
MKQMLSIGAMLLVIFVGRAQSPAGDHAQRPTANQAQPAPSTNTQPVAAILQANPCHQRHTEMGGVRLDLRGVYIDRGLLWLVFRGVNHSAIDFRPATMHIAIRDKYALKRRALQERPLTPVIKYEPSVVRADSTVAFCYGLIPRIPGKKQELSIEWMEKNGDRRLLLRLNATSILTARKVSPAVQKN